MLTIPERRRVDAISQNLTFDSDPRSPTIARIGDWPSPSSRYTIHLISLGSRVLALPLIVPQVPAA